jgi:hypothetical protein
MILKNIGWKAMPHIHARLRPRIRTPMNKPVGAEV